MKLLENNLSIYIILGLAFISGVVTIFLTQNSYGGPDNFSHYKFAHWGWQYPELLFNHWGKPLFTILMSPFAQFGIVGARVYNLFVGFSTALIVWKLAIHFDFKNNAISLILVLFTPIYLILMFTTLTEVTFSFFLALSVLLFFKNKLIFSAIVASLLPLVRTEGIVLLPLFMIAYGLKKQFIAIPMLTAGFWIISLLGLPYYDDFWWLITKMPYSGNAKDIYGSGSLYSFINNTRGILGYPIGVLSVIGLLTSLIHWAKYNKYSFSDTFYFLLLIPGSYIAFLSAHSFVWWQGMGNSLGLIRVMASVTPMASLTALAGLLWLTTWLKSKNNLAYIIFTTCLLVWIVILGINTHIDGFKNSRPEKLIAQAAHYLKDNNLIKHKIHYFDPYLISELGIDPFDKTLSVEGIANKKQPSLSLSDSSIIVWDAHLGTNQGKIPLSVLISSEDLVLLKEFKPIPPFKVLGGYDYAVCIFQKRSNNFDNLK